jgi:pilus assembly protein Flp/PilA
MRNIKSFATRMLKDESGAAAVEYGLLIAGIAAVIVAIVFTIGTKVQAAFQTVCTKLNNNAACS